MTAKYQIQTPSNYVIDMLNYLGYQRDLYGKTVLENSCGQGNILVEVVKRYIQDCLEQGYTKTQIAEGLKKDICAFEKDKQSYLECIRRLNDVVKMYGLPKINWNINNKDFLKSEKQKYDYVVGNPPYITYHELKEEDREFLKKNYSTCQHGRFDYSYAFIQASVDALKPNGKMIYLVPYSILTNKFAKELRNYIKPFVCCIYNFTGITVFPEAIVSAIMIQCENASGIASIEFKMMTSKKLYTVNKCKLDDKWVLLDQSKQKKTLGDDFEIINSVATLCNDAFVLSDYVKDGDYYLVGNYKIECKLVKNAISVKSGKRIPEKKKKTKIIFPYKRQGNNIVNYDETEFKRLFPEACKYLKSFKKKLKKRKSDENAKWYEYGRSQAIKKIYGDKLVTSMVVTGKVKVYRASKNTIPYAGYFIKCKQGSSKTLDDAKKILESTEFLDYVKKCGTPTTATSYRVSVNDIKAFVTE